MTSARQRLEAEGVRQDGLHSQAAVQGVAEIRRKARTAARSDVMVRSPLRPARWHARHPSHWFFDRRISRRLHTAQ